MAMIDVECSECGAGLQLDDALLGSTTTCPMCKMPFVVEPAGAYELADDPPRRLARSPSAEAAPEPQETPEQRRIRERMERWAGAEDA